MLWLKRVQYFNDVLICRATGDYITHGDYYYEDDEDGLIIKASAYRDLKDQHEQDYFDQSRLLGFQNRYDYEQAMWRATNDAFALDVVKRKIARKELN